MMSNEEMVRNVFRRTDEYFQKKEKRNNKIKKGASFMSLFSIITLAGLGLWSSNIQSPVLPDEPSKIAIVQTNYETTATTVYSETNNTVTTAAASVSSSPVSGTSDLTQTDNTTADTEVVTTAPVNIQTTAGITSTVTVTVNENNTTTAKTTVSDTVTTEETVSTTTTALPETEPSPAATDLDKTIDNVVSVGDDFITVELSAGASYDYLTFYNHPATMYYAYVWSYVETDFYVVTADSEEELADIVLPDGAEIAVIEYSGNNTSWEYIDEKTIISELTDPYILVKGAEPEELYQIDGVKDVYDVNAYTSTSASIYSETRVSILTSVLDRELTIEDFAGIDGITAVTMGLKSYFTEQMAYSIEFENSEKSDIRIFDICKKLVELEIVDRAVPDIYYDEVYYHPVHVVELVENPYVNDEENRTETIYDKYTFEELLALSAEEICTTSDKAAEAYAYGTEHYGQSQTLLVWADQSADHESFMLPNGVGCKIDGEGQFSDSDIVYALHAFTVDALEYGSYDPAHVQGVMTVWLAINPAVVSYEYQLDAGTDTSEPVTGDIDGNGTVDISDATAVLSMYAESAAGITPAIYIGAASNPADVNGDGVVSLDDATAILLYYAQTASGLSPEWADIINK